MMTWLAYWLPTWHGLLSGLDTAAASLCFPLRLSTAYIAGEAGNRHHLRLGPCAGSSGRFLPAARFAAHVLYTPRGSGRPGVHHARPHGPYEPGNAGTVQPYSHGRKA